MQDHSSGRTALARLVLFSVVLSLAGCIVACIHYAAIDQPAQDKEQATLPAYTCVGVAASAPMWYTSPRPARRTRGTMRACRSAGMNT